jgi:MFS family permease
VHGICYAFFFATVYIFVDEFFPKDVRSSAQGLFNVLILGIGPFAANFACGRLKDQYTVDKVVDYHIVFQYSMFAAMIGAAMLFLFFYPPTDKAAEPPHSSPEEESPPAA